ncbi:hypothetical protein EG329_003175 [Mollisiaceae sp. DMI_Dod_QoI]|nr:hypothetical protein EG329_003175 [Helotiales sp. DMI_Dod_QoI]
MSRRSRYLENDYCFLVLRRDYCEQDEDGHIAEIFGCYGTSGEASKRARAEAKRAHRNAFDAQDEEIDVYQGFPMYGAEITIYDGYHDIERCAIYVEKIHREREFNHDPFSDDDDDDDDEDGDEDSDPMEDEEEDVYEDHVETPQPRPPVRQESATVQPRQPNNGPSHNPGTNYTYQLPLPTGTQDCLAGWCFAIAGSQHPHSREAITSLITYYGGTILPLIPVSNAMTFIITGTGIEPECFRRDSKRKRPTGGRLVRYQTSVGMAIVWTTPEISFEDMDLSTALIVPGVDFEILLQQVDEDRRRAFMRRASDMAMVMSWRDNMRIETRTGGARSAVTEDAPGTDAPSSGNHLQSESSTITNNQDRQRSFCPKDLIQLTLERDGPELPIPHGVANCLSGHSFVLLGIHDWEDFKLTESQIERYGGTIIHSLPNVSNINLNDINIIITGSNFDDHNPRTRGRNQRIRNLGIPRVTQRQLFELINQSREAVALAVSLMDGFFRDGDNVGNTSTNTHSSIRSEHADSTGSAPGEALRLVRPNSINAEGAVQIEPTRISTGISPAVFNGGGGDREPIAAAGPSRLALQALSPNTSNSIIRRGSPDEDDDEIERGRNPKRQRMSASSGLGMQHLLC